MRVCMFKRGSDAQQKMLVGDGTEELETHGKILGREAAGDGDGGEAGEIGGAVGAKEKRASGMLDVAEADGFLADEGRGDWSRGIDQSIHAVVLESQVELLDELFAEFEGVEISRGGDFGAHFETGADVFAVVGGA